MTHRSTQGPKMNVRVPTVGTSDCSSRTLKFRMSEVLSQLFIFLASDVRKESDDPNADLWLMTIKKIPFVTGEALTN